MADHLKEWVSKAKEEMTKTHTEHIAAFAEKDIILSLKTKKVSYVKGRLTLAVEFWLIPKKAREQRKKHWKYFAQKFVTLKQSKKGSYTVVRTYKSSVLLSLFLKHNLLLASRKAVEKVCMESIGNVLLRLLCFSRFHKFPHTYRGRDFSIVLFLLLLLFHAIIIGTARNWYAWW